MELNTNANRSQIADLLLNPWGHVSVRGRGTGKSREIGFKIDKLNRLMPRSVIAITGPTYGHILTGMMPSTFATLNELGYENGVNYVIGRKPPAHFLSSYEEINKHDNYISFSNGTKYAMISLTEKGSGRGKNIDFEIVDECGIINIDQYNNEIKPANRGNVAHFGKCPLHHGFHYSTSMPQTDKGKWILELAKYYEEERNIQLFNIWNKIVMLQIELLELDNTKLFMQCWNEIERLRKQIAPFVSKDNILFTVGNAFDNIKEVGISYFRNAKRMQPYLVFMIEFMNFLFDKVVDCFYSIDTNRHVYYNGLDDSYIIDLAKDSNYNIDKLSHQTSKFDKDCNAALPLEVVFDWGTNISVMCVCQERNYDFLNYLTTQTPVLHFINEFYVKPDGSTSVLINDLVNKFCDYYSQHVNKNLIFYRDRHGDKKNPNVVNYKSYNKQAIEQFEKRGWKVEERVHPGQEPAMSDKYLLWGNLLSEADPALPKIRFNGSRCKFTLISMNNANTKDYEGKIVKNKTSERSKTLPQEEATHFSDAADKIVYTKYNEYRFSSGGDFVPARV